MRLDTVSLACFCAGILFASPGNAAPGFDPKSLIQSGEVYVVALHETYMDAASRTGAKGKTEVANFFRDRAIEIEHGSELFPEHPSVYPCADERTDRELNDAYQETFAVATSEAADVEPYLVARVQIAYEEWLISMHTDAHDASGGALHDSFERRLDALTAPQIMSHAAPPAPTAPDGVAKATFTLIGTLHHVGRA